MVNKETIIVQNGSFERAVFIMYTIVLKTAQFLSYGVPFLTCRL